MITVTNQQLISSFWRNLNERSDDWKSVRYFYLPTLGGKDIQHGCAYQSEKDPTLGCAIGQALIDLGLMDERIAKFYGGVPVLVNLLDLPFQFENIDFAKKLQQIHDMPFRVEVATRKNSVRNLAQDYGLTLEDYDNP